ncbi:MAG TPA: hypothetical protein VNN77_00505 [candidate division Zixibacteria bacterium]|nr:hypothetical protein [candidate division Zixibacteria bacterium]
MKAKRGKDNAAGKVGMYLMKRFCDLAHAGKGTSFGLGRYRIVSPSQ